MSSRPKGYGLTRDLEDKMRAKYSEDQESEVAEWIKCRTGLEFTGSGQDDFRAFLLDGTVLCALINSFDLPGISCKPNDTSCIKLQAMKNIKEDENIGIFLSAAEKIGMKRIDMFQTVNIRDNTNMSQVLCTLQSLGMYAYNKGVTGPLIGTKMADENKRNFDEESQRAGRAQIGLQMGTNVLASQSGMTGYGQTRQIVSKTD
ncbi:transgelin-3-like [Styela clava]